MRKEYRVVNIEKPVFDKIKKYCTKNALSISRWVSKVMLEKINKK